MNDWFPLIGMVTILLNTVAAIFWGVKTIAAKNALLKRSRTKLLP